MHFENKIAPFVALTFTFLFIACEAETKPMRVLAVPNLRLREEPVMTSKVIAFPKYGETVESYGEEGEQEFHDGVRGRWSKVRYKDQEGYVFGGFLKAIEASKVRAAPEKRPSGTENIFSKKLRGMPLKSIIIWSVIAILGLILLILIIRRRFTIMQKIREFLRADDDRKTSEKRVVIAREKRGAAPERKVGKEIGQVIRKPPVISSGVGAAIWVGALIGFFLTWVKYDVSASYLISLHESINFSGARLGDFLRQYPQISTIIIPFVLYLFPVCVIGAALADFVPQISRYKRVFIITALVLIVYAAIGIFTMGLPLVSLVKKYANVSFSAGLGLYISLLATIAGALYSGVLGYLLDRITKK